LIVDQTRSSPNFFASGSSHALRFGDTLSFIVERMAPASLGIFPERHRIHGFVARIEQLDFRVFKLESRNAVGIGGHQSLIFASVRFPIRPESLLKSAGMS